MQKIRKILNVAPEKNSGQTNKETQGKKNKKKQNRRKVFYIAFTLWVQRMNQRNRHQQMQNCDCT